MIILGKVYPRGNDGLLGAFKAVLWVLLHATKAHGRTHARTHARMSARMSARMHARMSAGAGAGARTHTHTHIGKTPPGQKIKAYFFSAAILAFFL